MRLSGTSVWLFCGVLLAVAPAALANITVAGSNVGTSYTIIAGDVIDYGGFAVQVTDPGTLTMTGGDVSSAGGTGAGVYMTGGSFDMTAGILGGGTSTGSGLHVRDGAATIGGSATLRGGTNSIGTGTGMHIDAGTVTVNGGTFYGGGSTGTGMNIRGGNVTVYSGTFYAGGSIGGAFDVSGGQLDVYGGVFHAAVNIRGGTTTIYGSAFSVDSVPVTTPLPYLVTGNTGTIDVTYLSGSTETITFNRFNQDRGTLILVPEPATLSLLALGGLAMLRRRSERWSGIVG
ncbi:MAG: PEP-CTERM sorting domain-containing protein [Phycisphaerae bacterium]|jgi:fibronectin-binding autotransporter adhesin|nr:PEP-CTERM sorting domain-containing protein [Phycisphaerae bacterium]